MKFFTFIISLLAVSGFSQIDLRETAQNHSTQCLTQDCPEGVGTLITNTYMGLTFCRASLVTPNTVITSAHCVEEFLKTPSCEGEAFFKFGDQVGECQKVVYSDYSEKNTSAPDIAIIQLKESLSTTPQTIQNSPFRDEQTFYYFKSLYSFSKNQSSFEKVFCKSKLGSSAGGQFFSQRPKTLSLSDCSFQDGDSGSPIFNEEGHIVAVLQGGLGQDALNIFQKIQVPGFNNISYMEVLSLYSQRKNQEFYPILIATNLDCLNYLPLHLPGHCSNTSLQRYLKPQLQDMHQDYLDYLHRFLDPRDYSLDTKLYQDLLKEEPDLLKLTPEDFSTTISPTISCKNLRSDTLVPIQIIESQFDSYFRVSFKVRYKITQPCQ